MTSNYYDFNNSICLEFYNDADDREIIEIVMESLRAKAKTAMDIDDYDTFVELFGDYLREDDDGILHLYTPHVFVVVDGQVVAERSGSVEGADPSIGLTDEQAEQLVAEYREMLSQILVDCGNC